MALDNPEMEIPTDTVHVVINGKKKHDKDEYLAQQIQDKLKKLSHLRGQDLIDIKGYVYRETMGTGRTSLPSIDEILDDEQMGIMYGPGKYQVCYEGTNPQTGSVEYCTIKYSCGVEYTDLHIQECKTSGRKCYLSESTAIPGMNQPRNFLSEMFEENKMKSIVALIGGLKLLLGNDKGNDKNDLFKIMMENQAKTFELLTNQNNKQTSLPEALVLRAFEMQAPKSSSELLGEQLSMLQALKDVTNPAPQIEERQDVEKSTFEKMAEKAVEFLPAILDRFGGNVQQAAAAVKKENPASRIMLHSRLAQKAFYKECASKHGLPQANSWARALGLNAMELEKDLHAEIDAKPVEIKPVSVQTAAPAAKPAQNQATAHKPAFKAKIVF